MSMTGRSALFPSSFRGGNRRIALSRALQGVGDKAVMLHLLDEGTQIRRSGGFSLSRPHGLFDFHEALTDQAHARMARDEFLQRLLHAARGFISVGQEILGAILAAVERRMLQRPREEEIVG